MIPQGRGVYIWRMSLTENGNLIAIIDKCHRCHIDWLAIKAGDQGQAWSQFTPAMVKALHAAGIRVYGWSYDVPGHVFDQVAVVERVKCAGADGYIIDAEIEWDHAPNPDISAATYAGRLAPLADNAFGIGDAPWDYIGGHPKFPFTQFSRAVSFRCPQAYHQAHGISIKATLARMFDSYAKYASQRPSAARPLVPSLGAWTGARVKDPVVADLAFAEATCKSAGCPGVVYWVWNSMPDYMFEVFENGTIPRY
jgi:hypothetical protein